MKNTNNGETLNKRNLKDSYTGNDKKNSKGSFQNIKKDVDEFDISTEYFTKDKLESDGEDF